MLKYQQRMCMAAPLIDQPSLELVWFDDLPDGSACKMRTGWVDRWLDENPHRKQHVNFPNGPRGSIVLTVCKDRSHISDMGTALDPNGSRNQTRNLGSGPVNGFDRPVRFPILEPKFSWSCIELNPS